MTDGESEDEAYDEVMRARWGLPGTVRFAYLHSNFDLIAKWFRQTYRRFTDALKCRETSNRSRYKAPEFPACTLILFQAVMNIISHTCSMCTFTERYTM